jgi:glutathione S-transferase
MYKLVIANRNYSSWSFRAWLFLTESKIDFEEIKIPLFTEAWSREVARYSSAGRVPVLLDDDITVWDTMAIIEYVRDRNRNAVAWPQSRRMYAHAWSVSAEMHSGFLAVRDELPQNIRARNKLELSQLSDSCRKEISRIDEIWAECRRNYGDSGQWLFGEFSVADIMFAPVALRFVTYSIQISDKAQEYVNAVLGSASVRQWVKAAREEPESISFIDDLVPAASSPLTLG